MYLTIHTFWSLLSLPNEGFLIKYIVKPTFGVQSNNFVKGILDLGLYKTTVSLKPLRAFVDFGVIFGPFGPEPARSPGPAPGLPKQSSLILGGV